MLYDSGVTQLKSGKRIVGTIALKVTAKCGFTPKWFIATGNGTQPQPLVAGDLVATTGGTRRRLRRRASRHRGRRLALPTPAPTVAPMIEAGGLLIGGDMSGRAVRVPAPPDTTGPAAYTGARGCDLVRARRPCARMPPRRRARRLRARRDRARRRIGALVRPRRRLRAAARVDRRPARRRARRAS